MCFGVDEGVQEVWQRFGLNWFEFSYPLSQLHDYKPMHVTERLQSLGSRYMHVPSRDQLVLCLQLWPKACFSLHSSGAYLFFLVFLVQDPSCKDRKKVNQHL